MAENRETDLHKAVWKLKPYLLGAFGFSAVITLLSLAPIGYMRDVYGPVMDSRSQHTLGMVTLVLVIALVLSTFVEWVRARVMAAASVKFAEQMAPRVFDATFTANLARHPGARMALGDLRLLRNFITSATLVAIMDAPLGMLFLLLVFMINEMMGVFALVGAVLVFVIGVWAERKVGPLVKEAQRYAAGAQNFVADSSRNAQTVEAMGMRSAVQKRWLAIQNEFLKNQALASSAQALGSSLSKVVMLAQGSLVLGVGVLLTIMEVLPPQAGAFLIVAKILGGKALAPLMILINSWKQIAAAQDAYERLDAFLSQYSEREERMALPSPSGHLAAQGAAIRAPGTKKTIQVDVSFVLKQGKTLAIIGPSGTGKSSLAKALLGIWPPFVGSIRLDGADIAAWDKRELGPHIGYLPQDVELFDGTIAENIARFGEVDRAKVQAAATLAGLESFVNDLPEGLDTQLGPEGAVLSGGQRQRVGLARALYGDPRLVVLDEPNSSLDERGEAALVQVILALKARGTTVVLITHRRNLVLLSDQVLILGEGRPEFYGPRDQVLARLGMAPAQPQTPAVTGPATPKTDVSPAT